MFKCVTSMRKNTEVKHKPFFYNISLHFEAPHTGSHSNSSRATHPRSWAAAINKITESSELEGTHKNHQAQLLSDGPYRNQTHDQRYDHDILGNTIKSHQ